jgi:DNA mismatch repair protein MutS
VLDLERLTARARVRPRQRPRPGRRCDRASNACHRSPRLRELPCAEPRRLATELDALPDLASAIAAALVDEPPNTIKEGGLIRTGHSAELDELRTLARDSSEWLARYQQELIDRTGIRA